MPDESAAPKTDEEPAKRGRKRTQVDLDKTIPTHPAPADPIHPGGAPPPIAGNFTDTPKFTCPICLKKVSIDVAVNNAENRPCHKECIDAAIRDIATDVKAEPPLGPISPPANLQPSVPQTKEDVAAQMDPVESLLDTATARPPAEPFQKIGTRKNTLKDKMTSMLEAQVETLEERKGKLQYELEQIDVKIEALHKTIEMIPEM